MSLFGMGIKVDYTDNATAGLLGTAEAFRQVNQESDGIVNSMNSQTQALNNLSMEGASNIYAGKQMMGMGTSILKSMYDTTMGIVNVGSSAEQTRVTLEALYKSKAIADEKLAWAIDFGARTPFDIEDTMSVLVGMKAAGVEVDEAVTTVGGHTQELLGYIGDLGALRPDVGIARMGYAIRNALGGNTKSLKAALDVDVDGLIGRKFGAGGAEKMPQDIADLVEALGAEGLMNKLFGTWGQMLSEIGDQMYRLKLAVADAGVFDGAKKLLKKLFDLMANISDQDIAKMGENLAVIFDRILKPVGFIVDRIVDLGKAFMDLLLHKPHLAELIIVFASIAGSALVLVGAIVILYGVTQVAVSVLGKIAIGITNFGLATIPANYTLGLFIKSLVIIALKVAVVIGVLKTLYKVFEKDIKKVAHSVSEAFRILALDVDEMMFALDRADTKDNVFGGLIRNIAKVSIVFRALKETWNGGVLSRDTFKKAQELGILPLIKTLLNLKEKAKLVWKGFKEGLESVARKTVEYSTIIIDKIKGIWKALKEWAESIPPIKKAMEDLEKALEDTEFDVTPYEKLGKALGVIVGILAVGKIAGALLGIATAVGKLATPIKFIFGLVKWLIVGIAGLLASNPILAMIAMTVAVIILNWDELKEYWETFKKYFNKFVDWFGKKFTEVSDKVEKFIGKMPSYAEVFEILKTKWGDVIGWFGEKFDGASDLLEGFVESVGTAYSDTKESIIRTWTELWDFLWGKSMEQWKKITDKIDEKKADWAQLKEDIKLIWDTFVTWFGLKFDEMSEKVKGWVEDVQTAWGEIKTIAINVWQYIVDWIKIKIYQLIDAVGIMKEFINTKWEEIKTKASNIWQAIVVFVQGKVQALQQKVQDMKEKINQWWEDIKTKASEIWELISGYAKTAVGVVMTAWNGVVAFFKGIWEGITSGARTMFNWIEQKFARMAEAIQNIKTTMGNIGTGIKDKAVSVKDATVKFFNRNQPLDTGGYIKGEGTAYLHPNEIVINDELTQKLRTFLGHNAEQKMPFETSMAIPSELLKDDKEEEVIEETITNNYISNTLARPVEPVTAKEEVNIDNSITIAEGAIQVVMTDGNDLELEDLADKLWDLIKKKQEIEKVMNYIPV